MKNAWRDSRSVLVSSAYLIDSVNQKKHLVVRANDNPMTLKVDQSKATRLSPSSSYKVWAKFPAPPIEVDSVSIYIPGTPPIEDVRIEG